MASRQVGEWPAWMVKNPGTGPIDYELRALQWKGVLPFLIAAVFLLGLIGGAIMVSP